MGLPNQRSTTRDNKEDINGDTEQDFPYLEPQQVTTTQTVSSKIIIFNIIILSYITMPNSSHINNCYFTHAVIT